MGDVNKFDYIEVIGARQHNLKNISIKIPKNKFVVITGLSGSGKSSLAFDTIYTEGQRRYIESLSSYARQFLNIQTKPDVDYVYGLSPAIAIDQKVVGRNPRSTVGTATEIYDYLRLLFARVGVPYSPVTGKPLEAQSVESMVLDIMTLPKGTKATILATLVKDSRGEHKKELVKVKKNGFTHVVVDGELISIENNLPKLDKTAKHTIDIVLLQTSVDEVNMHKITNAVSLGLEYNNGVILVQVDQFPDKEIEKYTIKRKEYGVGDKIRFSSKYSCPESGMTIESIEPRLLSFNNPFGACKYCDGLGTELKFDKNLIILDPTLTIREGAIDPWRYDAKCRVYIKMIAALGKIYGFNIDTPFYKYPDEVKDIIFNGSDRPIEIEYEGNLRTSREKICFAGVLNILEQKYIKNKDELLRDELGKYQSKVVCTHCHGYRLNEEALSIKVGGKNIGEVCSMSIEDLSKFIKNLINVLDDSKKIIGDKILGEIGKRLEFLEDVGLSYLTLDRPSTTLSGGEGQRIRLATQIATGLSGVVYVLDEPSIGLHQSDNQKLIKTMKLLRDIGNTVIVVEHDEETMLSADWLIDIGPGAGLNGGHVIAQGTPEDVLKNPNSITGAYLSGKKAIPIPVRRRKIKEGRQIVIKNARGNNLKNIDVAFPLGVFCSVTGVSGGGKSTLVLYTLYRALSRLLMGSKINAAPYDKIEGLSSVDKIIQIDQTPIGRTPRSNPCNYVGVFTYIRDLFASLEESKSRGFTVNQFSFNVKGGRCEHCQGDGSIKIEMHFLPDVFIQCPVCNGKRYNRDILDIKYNGKNISDILDLNVDEACKFFADKPLIYDKCKALKDVGLGYIKMGQSATTLSGGEAQRIKLAKELSKKDTGNTIYILDEPTTGLHSDDIKRLLGVLHKLVEQGNTVIVIEHNLDVIKTSDWVIDIGPKGGNEGGYVVAEGTPEQICNNDNSVTGKFLKIEMDRYYRNKKNLETNTAVNGTK